MFYRLADMNLDVGETAIKAPIDLCRHRQVIITIFSLT